MATETGFSDRPDLIRTQPVPAGQTRNDVPAREEIDELVRSRGFARVVGAIRTQIARNEKALRSEADYANLRVLQGSIGALEWVLQLPTQLNKQAGGQDVKIPEEE